MTGHPLQRRYFLKRVGALGALGIGGGSALNSAPFIPQTSQAHRRQSLPTIPPRNTK